MAKNLTASTTWASNVTVPEGGDARRASTVETPFQQLTDRTAYLKDKVDVTGVNRLRYALDYSAAAAITGLTTGDFVVVGHDGLYRFESNSTNNPYQFISNSSTVIPVTSGGILCLVGADKADWNGTRPEFAPVWTNGSGTLQFPDVVVNRVVFSQSFVKDTVWDIADPNYHKIDDVTAYTGWTQLTHSLWGALEKNIYGAQTGDILVFQMSGSAYIVNSNPSLINLGYVQGFVDLGAGDVPIPGAIAQLGYAGTSPDGTIAGFSLLGEYTMPSNAGVYSVVKPCGRVASSTTTMTFLSGVSFRVTCLRP